jgi:diguanylate cyclase (GGDEF)-like protein/PAS domain S-box-containing protein
MTPKRSARSSRQFLRLALKSAQMGTCVWDVESSAVSWWDDSDAIDGAAPGFKGTFDSFLALVHANDRETVRRCFERAAREGGSFDIEFRTTPPTGAIRWWALAGEPAYDRSGRLTQVVGVARNISAREQARDELREAQDRYQTLVEELPLASYVEHLHDESASYISPQIADLVGYTADEWVADSSFFSSVLHPDDRERVLAGFAAMHASGERFDCEYRLIARDGRVVWIHDSAVVVRDEAGRHRYAQGYMIDISERKRQEDALRVAHEQQRRQMDKIEHQALHDGLTNLPNRTLFHDRVQQVLVRSKRERYRFAVMLIDLDRFKEVNDTLGHQAGDVLLKQVANSLLDALRASDTVARLGGDEFAVLAPAVPDAATATAVAQKLRGAVAQPVVIAGLQVEVEASVGVALFPEHGEDVETLIRHADVSMYASKSTHVPVVYAAEHDHHSVARLTLLAELRQGLRRNELILHYQPQMMAVTGEIHSAEALARWQHPQHGLLGPDSFIPLAEQSGLIRSLTSHVLDKALAQCSAWHADGRALGVAVNITSRELIDLAFPEDVAGLLAKWRVQPAMLELEITETTILVDPPRTREVLAGLRDIGVRLAIDDFGSGHSSLSYLKRLPIDVLKIDKSFVLTMAHDADDAIIVRSIIDLGHNLGLQVVAEGVETEATSRRLAELRCDRLQGYHLGRPEPASSASWLPRPTSRPNASREPG